MKIPFLIIALLISLFPPTVSAEVPEFVCTSPASDESVKNYLDSDKGYTIFTAKLLEQTMLNQGEAVLKHESTSKGQVVSYGEMLHIVDIEKFYLNADERDDTIMLSLSYHDISGYNCLDLGGPVTLKKGQSYLYVVYTGEYGKSTIAAVGEINDPVSKKIINETNQHVTVPFKGTQKENVEFRLERTQQHIYGLVDQLEYLLMELQYWLSYKKS